MISIDSVLRILCNQCSYFSDVQAYPAATLHTNSGLANDCGVIQNRLFTYAILLERTAKDASNRRCFRFHRYDSIAVRHRDQRI
jgi:hypothetical protein